MKFLSLGLKIETSREAFHLYYKRPSRTFQNRITFTHKNCFFPFPCLPFDRGRYCSPLDVLYDYLYLSCLSGQSFINFGVSRCASASNNWHLGIRALPYMDNRSRPWNARAQLARLFSISLKARGKMHNVTFTRSCDWELRFWVIDLTRNV